MNLKTLILLTVLSLSFSLGAFILFGRDETKRPDMKTPLPTPTVTPLPAEPEPVPTTPIYNPNEPVEPTQPITYSCPANGYIDCMPIVAPERKYQCSEPYLNWVKTNCPDFKGVTY